jgi:hypothetical protein
VCVHGFGDHKSAHALCDAQSAAVSQSHTAVMYGYRAQGIAPGPQAQHGKCSGILHTQASAVCRVRHVEQSWLALRQCLIGPCTQHAWSLLISKCLPLPCTFLCMSLSQAAPQTSGCCRRMQAHLQSCRRGSHAQTWLLIWTTHRRSCQRSWRGAHMPTTVQECTCRGDTSSCQLGPGLCATSLVVHHTTQLCRCLLGLVACSFSREGLLVLRV